MSGYWNHRVVRREYPNATPSERYLYEIHEAHYHPGDMQPYAITMDAVDPIGETVGELIEVLGMMRKACDRPVLDYVTREELP